jgi:hypothetical protein
MSGPITLEKRFYSMHLTNGTIPFLTAASDDSLVAIDIGFASGSNSSCGISKRQEGGFESWNSAYGDMVLFLAKWPLPELHLILEAPLFFVFDENGNPAGRLPFEDPSHYWYLRAGITVAFAAVNLLHELLRAGADYRLILYEGYMPNFGGRRRAHALDATGLLASAGDKGNIVQHERSQFKGTVRCIQYYLGLPEPIGLAPVVQPL